MSDNRDMPQMTSAIDMEKYHKRKAFEAEADDYIKSLGVIELAIRNRSLSEYMEHWESRATKAEREIAALKSEMHALRAAAQFACILPTDELHTVPKDIGDAMRSWWDNIDKSYDPSQADVENMMRRIFQIGGGEG